MADQELFSPGNHRGTGQRPQLIDTSQQFTPPPFFPSIQLTIKIGAIQFRLHCLKASKRAGLLPMQIAPFNNLSSRRCCRNQCHGFFDTGFDLWNIILRAHAFIEKITPNTNKTVLTVFFLIFLILSVPGTVLCTIVSSSLLL